MGWFGPQGGDCGCCGDASCEEVTGSWSALSGTWEAAPPGSGFDGFRCTSGSGTYLFTPTSGISPGDRWWWSCSHPGEGGGFIFDAIDVDNCHRLICTSNPATGSDPYVYMLQDVTAGVVTDIEEVLAYQSGSTNFCSFTDAGSYLHLAHSYNAPVIYSVNSFVPSDGSFSRKGGNLFGLYCFDSTPTFYIVQSGVPMIGRSACYTAGRVDPGSPDDNTIDYRSYFARNNQIRVHNSLASGVGSDPGGSVTAELNVTGFSLDPGYACTSVTSPCPCDEAGMYEKFFGPYELSNMTESIGGTEYRMRFGISELHSISQCRNRIDGTEYRWSIVGGAGVGAGLVITNPLGLTAGGAGIAGYGINGDGSFQELPPGIFKLTYYHGILSRQSSSSTIATVLWTYEKEDVSLADMRPGSSIVMPRTSVTTTGLVPFQPFGTWSGGDQVTIHFDGP